MQNRPLLVCIMGMNFIIPNAWSMVAGLAFNIAVPLVAAGGAIFFASSPPDYLFGWKERAIAKLSPWLMIILACLWLRFSTWSWIKATNLYFQYRRHINYYTGEYEGPPVEGIGPYEPST